LSDSSEFAILKLADFGLSAVIFAMEDNPHAADGQNFSTGQREVPQSQSFQSRQNCSPQSVSGNQCKYGMDVNNVSDRREGPPSPGIIVAPELGPLRHYSESLVSFPPVPSSVMRVHSVVGSPHYVAPEVSCSGSILSCLKFILDYFHKLTYFY
jgi:hypothetical protein